MKKGYGDSWIMPSDFYLQYLNSREWKLKRKAVIRRAQNICERCRHARIEDVHHLSYFHLGYESLEELQGLCRHCHEWVTFNRES